MRKKIFVFLMVFIFLFAQVGAVYAKGFSAGRSSGGARSFSRSSGGFSGSSFSKSGGFSSGSKSSGFSSSSKSGGTSSGKSSKSSASSGGYTGSSSSRTPSSSGGSSRSVPGAYSSSGSNAKSGKSTTAKSSYMQDQYKKEMSNSNYKAYQQKLNDEQKKVYDSSMNSSYRVNNRMNFEDAMASRPQRISAFDSRPVRIHVNTFYFGGPLSYGSAFVGPWDLWFLMRASDLFWYHHWAEIYAYRNYFDAAEFAARERAMRTMEQQNLARDPSYMDPDVDPDLQLSNDYQQKHLDNLYYTGRHPDAGTNPVATVIIIVVIIAGAILVIRYFSKPKPKRPSESRIY